MIFFAQPVPHPAQLTIDFTHPGVSVSPNLYGLMTEEINYSYDGGLYGELIRNRAFLDDQKQPAHWSPQGQGSAISLEKSGPTVARPMALRVKGGAANDGYWGFPVTPRTDYQLSAWVKSDSTGPILATLESVSGSTVYARASLKGVTSNWQNLETVLKTSSGIKPTTDARLVLRTAPGTTILLSQVSLFPPTFKRRPNGNRRDLMKMLVDMKPQFLRFPGGNYLEGNTLADRYAFQNTVGPIESRPGHLSPWGYRSTDGMGLFEFLLWSEEMRAKPLLAVYAGYALKGEYIKPGPELTPFVQDALDEIEYVIGGAGTKWGAQRVKDGHPKPFPLECVEVGNEDGFDKSGSYEGRFVQFYDAIKLKYPNLKVISTTGGKDWPGLMFPMVQRSPDLVDEHYYSECWDMMAMATRFDGYSRTGPKVFVGEWAAHDLVAPWAGENPNGPTPNMRCAIAEAAFMTGLERNSDVVAMSCYAPLLVNVNPGGHQWAINLIGYDALSSFGSPSYYAQTMFANSIGNQTVPTVLANVPMQTDGKRSQSGLFASATRKTATGALFVKVVNALSTPQDIELNIKGASVDPTGTISVLTGDLKAMNSLAEPKNVVPKTKMLTGVSPSFHCMLPPNSISVIKLRVGR